MGILEPVTTCLMCESEKYDQNMNQMSYQDMVWTNK